MRASGACETPSTVAHRFGRGITLDWYDGLVEGIVCCANCRQWFHCWLVSWRPDDPVKVYALRRVDENWVEALVRSLGQEPSWPWWIPQFDDHVRKAVEAALSALPSVASGTPVIVGSFSNIGNPPLSLRKMEGGVLGAWSRPRDIETIVDQDPGERARIRELLS
jgi:hypothetical protein